MNEQEWSRSRFWLCYFLDNRHRRAKRQWSTASFASKDQLRPILHRYVSLVRSADLQARQWMIDEAARTLTHDPALVQSLRLLIKEQQYHDRELSVLLVGSDQSGQSTDLPHRVYRAVRRRLGLRYEMARLLISLIVQYEWLSALRENWPDFGTTALCTQLQHDMQGHIAFLRERLTHEFAEFNFARRNLRRWRLRGLFTLRVSRMTWHARASLRELGLSPRVLAHRSLDHFEQVLRQMVPYHRGELVRQLQGQQSEPFAEAHLLPQVMGG